MVPRPTELKQQQLKKSAFRISWSSDSVKNLNLEIYSINDWT